MNNIPRELIVDLLPSYLAEEVSDETRIIIEQFLRDSPELTQLLDKQFSLEDDIPIQLNKEHEMNSFKRTKRLMNQKSILMAFALFVTFLPFSIWGGSDGIRWAWAEQPIVAVISFVAALILWAVYLVLSRQLSKLA